MPVLLFGDARPRPTQRGGQPATSTRRTYGCFPGVSLTWGLPCSRRMFCVDAVFAAQEVDNSSV